MKLLSIRDGAAVGPLAERIDRWVETQLEPYLRRSPSNPHRTGKTFQDVIWGAIELKPVELYLLDSPILQRLRYVAQLGVAHFLFPTIGYSRFEHSLGALHQVSRMIEALLATRDRAEVIRQIGYQQCLRYAALLHDVGHCAFSHVSEKFYQFHPDVESARAALGQLYRKRPSASEVLSILIVTSPSVRRLLQIPVEPGGERALDDEEGIELIAAAIAGADADPWHPYLTHMINGTIDCDKLDYLSRDGGMAGTPVMLDVTRLLSKLRVAKTSQREDLFALGLDITGTRALEELLATRVFLYDKIYFHHKILAAEELLRRGFAELEKGLSDVRDPAFLLNYVDEDFLRFRIELPSGLERAEMDHIEEARRLFRKVHDRSLPRRQYALAHRFWLRPPSVLAEIAAVLPVEEVRYDKKVARNVLDRLAIDEERIRLVEEIRVLAGEFQVEPEVYIAWPDAQRVAFGTGDVPAVDADGGVSDLATIFAAELWVEAYGANKQTGYVFADEPRPEVFLAIERALAARKLQLEDLAWKFSKISNRDVQNVRHRILVERRTDWLPHRLPPNYLLSDEGIARVDAVAETLAQYLSPHSIDPVQWIRAWLWQFPDADLQESALRMISQLRIVNRADRNESWQWFTSTVARHRRWSELAARGRRAGSSSARVGYETKDLGDGAPEIRKLWDWSVDDLRQENAAVFFDDILCSGTQAASLLYSWMGKPELAPSFSDRDEPLAPEFQEVLRSVALHFLYPIGWPEGRERLLRAFDDLALEGHVHFLLDGRSAGATFDSTEFASEDSTARLADFLAQRGTALLKASKPEWPTERLQDFAFGYGGMRALVASDHSVPTATVTAVWMHDYRPETLWLPLLPRDIAAYRVFWEQITHEKKRRAAARTPD